MHGYELKLELQYKHVRWWAKCEHGHLYAALKRLEKLGLIKGAIRKQGKRKRRVFSITAAGRRWLRRSLRELASSPDSTYFDVDLFLSGTFFLKQEDVIDLLRDRVRILVDQRRDAQALLDSMGALVPAVGRIVMRHRIRHLEHEADFARDAAKALAAEKSWDPFLGKRSITEFIQRTSVPLEG